MSEVKRYNVYDRHLSQGGGHDFEEDSEGDYVTYTDHANRIKEMEAELEKVKREARNEARREAAKRIIECYLDLGQAACALTLRDEILALMEDTDDD